jgi:hypothetical protein
MGNDTLLLDLSAGTNLPLSFANIESVQILATASASLYLTPSQISLNSTVISYSGPTSFQLNSSVLDSLTLSSVTVKLATNHLVVANGYAPDLREYLFNGATGATPALIPSDASTTLALLDNSKLHKTSFAGISLTAPFSQLLIQPALQGDANLDGKVDNEDILAIYANFNKSNATWLDGDVNQDGCVNLADLALAQSQITPPVSQTLKITSNPIRGKKSTPKHKLKHRKSR